MRLEEALHAYLTNQMHVPLYPFIMPQSMTLPAIVYLPVSVSRLHGLLFDTGFVKHRLQLTSFSMSYKQAVETALALKALLQNFSGMMGDLWIGGTLLLDERSDYEKDTQVYSVQLEFEFHYEEVG